MTTLVVAGGGLAGAAAACALARAGETVRILERSTGPGDKICGEFLSTEAQHYLHRIGLDPAGLGGHVITHVRVISGGRSVRTSLPFQGLGLSRRVLDEALLAHATSCGVEVRRGVTVSALTPDIRFLATGKHELRGERRVPDADAKGLVGFKMYLRLAPAQSAALAGTVEVIWFADGYAGLQLVEAGRANLCLLVQRDRLARLGGGWPALLDDLMRENAHLRLRLAGSDALLDRPLTIARVPYGFMHRPVPGEGVFRLGDQACVTPSFSGDGMAMALHSAALAVRCTLRGEPPEAYHRQLRRDVGGPIGRAGALYRLGRWDGGQGLVLRALGVWPGLLRAAARATRVARSDWVLD